MKILFVGEIVAKPGRQAVKEILPKVIDQFKPDLVLANVENIAHGRGVTKDKLDEMQNVGINFFTSGDHVFWQRGTEDFIDELPLVRPANYPKGAIGVGHKVVDVGAKGKVLVINLMGRTSFSSLVAYLDDPFRKADEILKMYKDEKLAAVVVDFHAEASSEKHAFAFYVDGRADAVVGSHTHVPTCDHRFLPKGTAYVTDVGMCGSVDSVVGVKTEIIQKLFLTAQNQRFEWEEAGKKAFRSVIIDTDAKTIDRYDELV